MKKVIAVLIIGLCSVALAIEASKEPVILVKDKITVDEATGSTTTENRVANYVDEKTVKVTTTIVETPKVREVEYDRAVLQTELDEIDERRIAPIQKQMDEALERKAELIKMLEVLK